jgi:hypothetical protein
MSNQFINGWKPLTKAVPINPDGTMEGLLVPEEIIEKDMAKYFDGGVEEYRKWKEENKEGLKKASQDILDSILYRENKKA